MPEVRSADITTFTTNVALVTTAETVVVASPVIPLETQTQKAVILAWAQLTTGTDTTTVTARIRRGATAGGDLVGEANAITIGAAVGSTEQFFIMTQEDRAGEASVQYCLTLTQAAASANGSALQGGILVLLL